MAGKTELIYWDSCVFLSYLMEDEGRIDTIAMAIEEIRESNGTRRIVTSAISITEVAFYAEEKAKKRADPVMLAQIEKLWKDSSVLGFIEVHDTIARRARDLIRSGLEKEWSLKAPDAIQLASAQWIDSQRMFTYDGGLEKYSVLIGREVCAPYVNQTRILLP